MRLLPRLLLLVPPAVFVGVLLVVPVVYLLQLSFFKATPGRMALEPGLTLFNYGKLLFDSFYLGVLANTAGLSLLITTLALALGFPLAYFLWLAPWRWKAMLTLLVVAPMMIGIVVKAFGWMILLGDAGVINDALRAVGLIDEPIPIMFTDAAIVVGLTHIQMPFMVLSILAALERIDVVMVEAAHTLGANRIQAVRQVVLPLAFPGVVAGCTLVFTLNMTAFATPALLGGSGPRRGWRSNGRDQRGCASDRRDMFEATSLLSNSRCAVPAAVSYPWSIEPPWKSGSTPKIRGARGV